MADFKTLRDRVFEALSDYDHELRSDSDKTRELTDVISALMVKKAKLEDQVKELTDTVAKLKVATDVAESPSRETPLERKVVHG